MTSRSSGGSIRGCADKDEVNTQAFIRKPLIGNSDDPDLNLREEKFVLSKMSRLKSEFIKI